MNYISETALISASTVLGDNIIIEDGVTILSNVMIYDNVIIRKNAHIGNNVILGYSEEDMKKVLENFTYIGSNERSINMEDISFDGEITDIGENTKIRSGSIIYNNCKVGDGSSIGHNTILREKTIIGENTYIGALVATEGEITIGDNCGINAQCHITRYSEIGDYVFFGPGIMSMNDNAMAHKREGHAQNMKGFTAEDYVRVGGGAILLPGVILGEGSVVAAGSIVTKDTPGYTLVKGSPARIIDEDSVRVNVALMVKE
jgi:acetyltransferase-like isoleucine patch superfamily enzyme